MIPPWAQPCGNIIVRRTRYWNLSQHYFLISNHAVVSLPRSIYSHTVCVESATPKLIVIWTHYNVNWSVDVFLAKNTKYVPLKGSPLAHSPTSGTSMLSRTPQGTNVPIFKTALISPIWVFWLDHIITSMFIFKLKYVKKVKKTNLKNHISITWRFLEGVWYTIGYWFSFLGSFNTLSKK